MVLQIISIVFHILTFFLLYLFFQELRKVKEERRELDEMREQIEELLVSSIHEMKRENEELKRLIPQHNHDSQRRKEVDFPDKQIQPETRDIKTSTHVYNHSTDSEPAPPPVTNKDKVEQSVASQVLLLAKEGYNTEEIAKQLKLGKGEVDLFLKFYHK